MKSIKKLLLPLLSKPAVPLLRLVIRFLQMTHRYEELNAQVKRTALGLSPRGNYLYALWHQNIICGAYMTMGSPHVCIVSPSRDGQLLSDIFQGFGHIVLKGSSSRGGGEAMISMIKTMNHDNIPGISGIDGPRGPARVPKHGIFKIAQKTQSTIIPVAAKARRYWEFASWDRFRLPKPFTTITIFYGSPIPVGEDIDRKDTDALASKLKKELDDGELYVTSKI